MVLISQSSHDAFQALKHNAEGRSNVVVCHLKGLQNECGQDNREVHIKLLLQQVHKSHPTPFYNDQIVHTRKGGKQLGRRGKMPKNFSPHPYYHNQNSIQKGQGKSARN